MSCNEHETRVPASNAASQPAFVARQIAGDREWNELRATRKALSMLSDRELADIGLIREDIGQIGC